MKINKENVQNWLAQTLKTWVLAIAFALIAPLSHGQSNTVQNGTLQEIVYEDAEEMPEFPGGEKALQAFLAKSIVYPAEAKKKGIQGKVYVRFVVNSKGNVTNISVAKKASPLLDKEAVRVVGLLPKWEPGKNKRNPVAIWYTVPINFVLSKK